MSLRLISIEPSGVVKVATQGNLTATDFALGGENPLATVIGQNWPKTRVMLDMNKSEYIDSSAIGWLIGSHKQFKSGGGALVIHGVRPSVRQVLDLLKVGKVVPLVADETAAQEVISAQA